MTPAAGIVVVLALLVLLPLGAVLLARSWRDPPRERWGIPQQARDAAAALPELAEYRVRTGHGIRDHRAWAAVEAAVQRGQAAPVELRPVAYELAGVRLTALERRLARVKPWAELALYGLTGASAVAIVVAAWAQSDPAALISLFYPAWIALRFTPYWLRRSARGARAALAANAP